MPLYIYDILSDGTATPTTDTSPTSVSGYRWFHFDLKDPELPQSVSYTHLTLPTIYSV